MDEKDEFRRFSSRYKTEKIKSRNLSEKKRRDQFNMLINELCSMVTSSNRKMDKSSVLRSTIAFLKNHSEISVQSQSVKVQENWKPSFLSNEEFTHLMLEALDGFIIVFSCNGQILYTSESTASLLGYLPSRAYSSVFDIIHEVDKSSLYKLISNPPSSMSNSLSKDSFMSITLHMKRGPMNAQTERYELVQLLGTFYHWPSSYESSNLALYDCDSNSSYGSLPSAGMELRSCFVAVGRLQTPHLLKIVNLSEDAKNEFTSRHSLEWKFLFLDHRAPPIIGYLPFEVLGTSGYDYYHVDDLDNIASSHELLMNTGEGTSCFYRFLTKGQQWIWLQTRYYISYHQWNSKPEFIVCTHSVVSTEKVLKNVQEPPQQRFPKQSCSSLPHTNSSPSQSACLSPSLSVSSLGSLSSEHSEQCCTKASSSSRVTSVLYPNPRIEKTPKPPLAPPPPPFAEPMAPPLPDYNNISSSEVISHPQPGSSSGIQPQNQHMSAPDRGPHNMMMDVNPSHQFSNEGSPLSQAQLQEYLRRRHQLLQQQIQAQQEELRRVSEQLMMVQFAQPPFQEPFQYPVQQQQQLPKEDYGGQHGRTYRNLDVDMCNVSNSERLAPLLSPEQTSEVIAQSYSLTHSMQSNHS